MERKNSSRIPEVENEEQDHGSTSAGNNNAAATDIFRFQHLTEFVKLPSGGLAYPPDSPLRKGEVELYYVLAPHEEIMNDVNLIQRNLMYDRLLKELIVDKTIDVSSLITSDKIALVVAARKNAYGPTYAGVVQCEVCGTHNEVEINIDTDTVTTNGLEGDLPEGVILTPNGFQTKLPKLGVDVRVKFIRGKEEKVINEFRLRHNLTEVKITDQYKVLVESVAGYSEPDIISKFVMGMPASDSKHIRDIYRKVHPNFRIEKLFVCSSCKTEQRRDAAFSGDFFLPR